MFYLVVIKGKYVSIFGEILLSLTKNTAIKNKQEQTKQSFEISNQIVITKIQLVDKQLLSVFLQRTIIQVYVLNQCLVTYNNR